MLVLLNEVHGDGTDFAVGSYSHVGSPDSCSGSDDIVHGTFLKVSA